MPLWKNSWDYKAFWNKTGSGGGKEDVSMKTEEEEEEEMTFWKDIWIIDHFGIKRPSSGRDVTMHKAEEGEEYAFKNELTMSVLEIHVHRSGGSGGGGGSFVLKEENFEQSIKRTVRTKI